MNFKYFIILTILITCSQIVSAYVKHIVMCHSDKDFLKNGRKIDIRCKLSYAPRIDIKRIDSYYNVNNQTERQETKSSKNNLLIKKCLNKRICILNKYILNDLLLIPEESCLNYNITWHCRSNKNGKIFEANKIYFILKIIKLYFRQE